MKKLQVATRTTDAVAAVLYDLMRHFVPAHAIEELVVKYENTRGAEILLTPLGTYAIQLAERLRDASEYMTKNDPIGTVGCPVGPPGTEGPTGGTGVNMGDFVFGEEELASGVVWVAGEDGVLYTATAGDTSHDTPEARARAILAQSCEEVGLPLSRVIRLRKELDKYLQRWNGTSSFPKTEKDHEEFKLMNTVMLRLGIEDYLEHPCRAAASALHARSAPLLARIGKESLLIQG